MWYSRAMGLNPDSFYTRRDGEYTLVYPRKTKWDWERWERPFRSVLFKGEEVVSAGFPKFFNLGENAEDTEMFWEAVENEQVEYVEKLDGTLIIVDKIAGGPHYRTRGQFGLGRFDYVAGFIERKYPKFLDVVFHGMVAEEFSILLEYTGPDNQIVLQYDKPEVHIIGMVDKRTLYPSFDFVHEISKYTGIPEPPYWAINQRAIPLVKQWTGHEGVVARFGSRKRRLLKIKTDSYVRLHALRYQFSEKRVRQFCYLYDVQSLEEAYKILGTHGMDFETFETISEHVTKYLLKMTQATAQYDEFRRFAWPHLTLERKEYVEYMKHALNHSMLWDGSWFRHAMLYYDGKLDDLKLEIIAKHVLDEHPLTVKQWTKDTFSLLTDGEPEDT